MRCVLQSRVLLQFAHFAFALADEDVPAFNDFHGFTTSSNEHGCTADILNGECLTGEPTLMWHPDGHYQIARGVAFSNVHFDCWAYLHGTETGFCSAFSFGQKPMPRPQRPSSGTRLHSGIKVLMFLRITSLLLPPPHSLASAYGVR